jgi:MFS family permease
MINEDPMDTADPRRWLVLVVVCSALCAIVIDNTILAIAVPSIGEQLGADETDLQWITTAYALVLSGLLLPLAVVGDRYGRRRCFVMGLLVFGAASAAAATVDTPLGLVVCRGAMGVGGAAAMPATLAIIGNVFAPAERPRALSVWSGVAGFAAAAGPLLGGLLLAHFWWGSVFLVNVPVVIVGVVAGLLLVPESRDPVAGRIDWAGAALWTGALVSVLFGIIEGPERGWSSGTVVGPLAVAVVLLAWFARHVVRASAPLLSPGTARHPGMRSGAALVTASFFALLGSQFILTQWLQGPRALGTLAASACFLPNAVASTGSAFANPRLVARVGEIRSVRIGGVVMTAGLVGVGAGMAADSLAAVVVAFGATGLGHGFLVPTGIELIMRSAPAAQAGEAAGVNETIIEAGGALGIAVMGSVLVGASSHAAPMLVAAAGLALGAVAAQRVQRRSGVITHA